VPFSAYHLKKSVEPSEKSVLGLVEKTPIYPTVKINNVLSVVVLLKHMAKPWAASSGLAVAAAAASAAMSMAPQQRQPWHWVAVFLLSSMAQQQQQPWQQGQALSDQRQCQHLAGSCTKSLEQGCNSGGSIGAAAAPASTAAAASDCCCSGRGRKSAQRLQIFGSSSDSCCGIGCGSSGSSNVHPNNQGRSGAAWLGS
jgi:hypothetical protein